MTAGDHPGASPAPVVFGDFWRQAARLASPPPYPDPPPSAQQVRHITAASLRAVTVMRRYLDDIPAAAGARDGSWSAAVLRAQAATARITGALRQKADVGPGYPAGPLAARLDGYAAALTYGRDLLHTHHATTAGGGRRALSDWAPVIGSAPVSRAILAGLAEHARAISGQLAALSPHLAGGRKTAAARQRLQVAAGQLRDLDAAIQAAQWQSPALPEHRQLLEAIPLNAMPAVQAPPPQATISTLCAGITATAQRASHARRQLAARAGWSPELTADSMRNTAANSVVTSFNTETVYQVLAERARQLGHHVLALDLEDAAARAGDARRAWLAVARVWDTMVTDTRGYLSRPAAEAGHLALWTGRLAYADPAWKPARGPSPAVRDPASLAPGPASFTQIAGALHNTADSLARAARTELDTINTAAAAGRLYVTTRSLPEWYDVPRPYVGAPPDRIAAAVAAYADAADTCQAVLHSAAQVAATVDARSQVLSTAGQATAHRATAPRGRLEQSLIDLGVRDDGLLIRGAGIDKMAQQVLAQACRSGLTSPQPDAGIAPEPSAGGLDVGPGHARQAPGAGSPGRERQARASLQPPGGAGQGKFAFAAAEPGVSLHAPEIGNEEPQLEL